MYECKVCGGQLRFQINDQQLHCEHCDGVFDPDSYDRDLFASRDAFDLTVYRCPNCGGEIATTNLSAVESCSYCGRTMLPEELKISEAMPQDIIPFQIDKEECIALYKKHLRKARCVPARMKDPAFLEQFRPVYVPYWSYDVDFTKSPKIPTSVSRKKGKYIITEHYQVTGDLSAGTSGILYDASSQLHDRIGQYVMPFYKRSEKPFNPSYLFGFFADRADTSSAIYEEEVRESATELIFNKLERSLPEEEIKENFKVPRKMEAGLGTAIKDAHCVMLPMWFLTWREGEQVAYAVINGETGKVYSDLPLDRGKFLLSSGITAAVLFAAAVFALPTLSIYTSVLLAAFCALASLVLYAHGQLEADRAALHYDDKGYRSAMGLVVEAAPSYRKKKKDKGAKLFGESLVVMVIYRLALIVCIAYGALTALMFFLGEVGFSTARDWRSIGYFWIGMLAIYPLYRIRENSRAYRASFRKLMDGREIPMKSQKDILLGAAGSIGAIVLSIAVHYCNPAHDLWYYLVMLLSVAGVAYSLLSLLKQYNELATHPEPHFFRGDES